MKVALICTGLGNVWRGYERFTRDLFELLKDDVSLTLFKGGGNSSLQEQVIPHFSRDGILSRFLDPKSARSPYYMEVLSFYVSLLPRLLTGGFDLVHFTDCPLANFLYHTKKRLGVRFGFKTLFTNGNPVIDGALHRVDALQQLTPWQVDAVRDFGVPESKIHHLPFAIYTEQFKPCKSRMELRQQYGIPQDAKVVLAVAAINRSHKRIDSVIEEVAALGPGHFLWVAGHMEDESLSALAARRLGRNFKFMHVAAQEANEIYGAADAFVMPSLIEGFGLAIVEAMAAKIPVIAHNSNHYKWMVGDQRSLTDLSRPGNLAKKIQEVFDDPSEWEEIAENNYENALERFDWHSLKEDYLNMYRKIVREEPVYEHA